LFYEEVEKQPLVLSFQSVVYQLEVFEKGMKLFDLVDFAVKPIQLVVSRNSTDCLLKIHNKISVMFANQL